MLLLFQLAFVVFSLIAIANIVRRRREQIFGLRGTIIWILFWVIADLAVIWPESTTVIANTFGIGRGTDFVVYLALTAIFAILFRLYVKIETINRDVTKVVREKAVDAIKGKE